MPAKVTILLVRHAQGYHNLGPEHHVIPDPVLTDLGHAQCAKLQETYFTPDRQKTISLITASPMTRTIQTAWDTFRPALTMNGKCKPEMLAIPDAQETSDFPCDTGSDLPVLEKRAAENGWPIDLSLLDDKWNIKTLKNRYSPASRLIKARARDCRRLLRQKARELVAAGDEDVQIVLVTHGGYLHYLTHDWEDADKWLGTGWDNTEYRPFIFEKEFESDEDPEAYIVETMENRMMRGKDYPVMSHAQNDEMFEKMLLGWEMQGLKNSKAEAEAEAKESGQEPADLDRVTTHAADQAESSSINTRPPSPKGFISVTGNDEANETIEQSSTEPTGATVKLDDAAEMNIKQDTTNEDSEKKASTNDDKGKTTLANSDNDKKSSTESTTSEKPTPVMSDDKGKKPCSESISSEQQASATTDDKGKKPRKQSSASVTNEHKNGVSARPLVVKASA
jgi:broad specificity phosphatase PhoE